MLNISQYICTRTFPESHAFVPSRLKLEVDLFYFKSKKEITNDADLAISDIRWRDADNFLETNSKSSQKATENPTQLSRMNPCSCPILSIFSPRLTVKPTLRQMAYISVRPTEKRVPGIEAKNRDIFQTYRSKF